MENEHGDFVSNLKIGDKFKSDQTGVIWTVTDRGFRVIVAADMSNALCKTPPYDVVEIVWDEYDQETIIPVDALTIDEENTLYLLAERLNNIRS